MKILLILVVVLALIININANPFDTNNEKLNKLEEVVTTKVSSVASSTQVDEEIIHTHIWATSYDTSNHWEYCTVCQEKRNIKSHT